jgi:hypothetical protein
MELPKDHFDPGEKAKKKYLCKELLAWPFNGSLASRAVLWSLRFTEGPCRAKEVGRSAELGRGKYK